ncbi:S-layer homology domain-containing protein [Lawsonibacter sp. LCP25S3_F5]
MRNLKRALSLALASVMVLGMTVVGTGASYTDVTSKQNQEAIEVLQAVGIMVGDDNGNFNPDQKVTRNEMAVVMSNLMDYRAATYAGTSPFTDVPSWAEPYVAACWNNGITSGYTKTTYGGSDSVTTSQAALMLMKALGYFQYSSDFGTDWQFATVKQANKIDLFDDVDSGVREAMTRNDLAQLVLNTLEAGTVEAEKDGQDIEVNGVTISSNVKYNYITSGKDYAYAINNTLTTDNNGTQSRGAIVELGEKLYSGDLKKSDSGDNFGRPGSTWTYKSSEIGKYADGADGEWTAKVTNKALYDAAGSDAYDNYHWTVYRNGSLVAQDYTGMNNNVAQYGHNGRDYAFSQTNGGQGRSKTSSDRVLTSGEGVLTQVFVDNTDKTAVLTLVDTGVAKVTKVTEDSTKGNYEVTVSYKTKVQKWDDTNKKYVSLTPDTKFTTDVKFAKGDVVVYNASASSNEIETMAVAKTVAGKVTAQKDADYTSVDGTKYAYNYAYTDTPMIANGIYNIEDSVIGDPDIDKDATLYLDAYGYVVAFEGKTSSAEDYLFVKGLDSAFGDVSAKVVFYDGTQKTVDLDQVNDNDAVYQDKGKKDNVTSDTVYKFSAGSSDYDLTSVPQNKLVTVKDGSAKISTKTPSIVTVDANNKETAVATADSQTVYVDVKNNKTWTGYKNVSNKNGANVAIVLNKDNVAEIVFIYGDFSSSANDDDFVILKDIGFETVKDANKKTTYRFTDAYDIHGNKIDDLYASSATPTGLTTKGLYLITKYNGDDYVTNMTRCTALQNTDGNVAGVNADIYAVSAKNGVLTLNTAIDLQKDNKTANDHKTFAIDGKTEYVVVELKKDGKVDTMRTGDVSDIETYETVLDAKGNVDLAKTNDANADMTGVYVITVDNDTDATPLAETILVIKPYV